jgi:hypothetical protein
MMPRSIDADVILPIAVFSIPILAITGGFAVAIVRHLGRLRLVELAQRERIAAIERGIDPSRLPGLDLRLIDPLAGSEAYERPGGALRRAQGLLIGGVVTLSTGLGLIAFFATMLRSEGERVWAVGLVPAFIGIGLLVSARLVWPRNGAGTDA